MTGTVVVGGGVGALAAAIRLAAAGHAVTVLERNPTVGGKLAGFERDGFSFETGPSLLTLPAVFEDLLSLAGMSLHEACELVRLDPACDHRFADGSGFRTRSTLEATLAEVEALAPGRSGQWRAFHDRGRRVWDVSARTFLAGPMESPAALIGRMGSPADLWAIDPLPPLARRAAATFDDARLGQWAGRYATYAGSSPYRAPATLACIPYVEQAFGSWYVRGGLQTLADVLARAATSLGVRLRTGAEVTRILHGTSTPSRARTGPHGRRDRIAGRRGGVVGVELAGGELVPAEVVVSDADAHHLYADLLPRRRRLARVRRAGRSSSGFVLLAAVDGTTPGLAHHTVSFSADYRREFAEIFDARVPPTDPTIYVCASSVTDGAQAPAGSENWFVLVNVPSGDHLDWERVGPVYRDRVLEVMAGRGWDVRDRLRWCETITPADIARRSRAVGGAIYGSSSNGRRSAFLRAANRGPVPGLYLVGGSAHPGGGLPLVATGGAIVAAMVEADLVGPAAARGGRTP